MKNWLSRNLYNDDMNGSIDLWCSCSRSRARTSTSCCGLEVGRTVGKTYVLCVLGTFVFQERYSCLCTSLNDHEKVLVRSVLSSNLGGNWVSFIDVLGDSCYFLKVLFFNLALVMMFSQLIFAIRSIVGNFQVLKFHNLQNTQKRMTKQKQ